MQIFCIKDNIFCLFLLDLQLKCHLLTIIYNKNTARSAYKNNQNQVLIFRFAQMNAALCIGEQNQKNNQLSKLSSPFRRVIV